MDGSVPIKLLLMMVLARMATGPEFDFIFNRRRNRMGKERASLLVYAHCNTRLLRRFKQVTYEENWVPCSDSEDSDPQDDPMDDDEDLE